MCHVRAMLICFRRKLVASLAASFTCDSTGGTGPPYPPFRGAFGGAGGAKGGASATFFASEGRLELPCQNALPTFQLFLVDLNDLNGGFTCVFSVWHPSALLVFSRGHLLRAHVHLLRREAGTTTPGISQMNQCQLCFLKILL